MPGAGAPPAALWRASLQSECGGGRSGPGDSSGSMAGDPAAFREPTSSGRAAEGQE